MKGETMRTETTTEKLFADGHSIRRADGTTYAVVDTPEEARDLLRIIDSYADLLAACKAACLAADMLRRNRVAIVSTMRHADGGAAGAAESMIGGMLRNLDHARAAIAKAEGGAA